MGDEDAGIREVVVDGTLIADDTGEAYDVHCRFSIAAGRGSFGLTLTLAGGTLRFAGSAADWVVTTNKGWAHLRGIGRLDRSERDAPFRMDVLEAGLVQRTGSDRLVLRIYAADDDPNLAAPVIKLAGSLGAGSVRSLPPRDRTLRGVDAPR